jgi:hypothetical protein
MNVPEVFKDVFCKTPFKGFYCCYYRGLQECTKIWIKWIELRRKIRNQEVSIYQLERETGIGRQTQGQQSAARLAENWLEGTTP